MCIRDRCSRSASCWWKVLFLFLTNTIKLSAVLPNRSDWGIYPNWQTGIWLSRWLPTGSVTVLDVYKRQHHFHAMFLVEIMRAATEILFRSEHLAAGDLMFAEQFEVTVDQLDVYKRQVYYIN